MAQDAPALTDALAGYVVSARWEALPESVQREAVRSFVNYVGCALGGSETEAVQIALAAHTGFAGPGVAGILGRRDRLDLVGAALVNCLSSAVHAFDDTHLRTITHPTGPVAATLLALAERDGIGGVDVLPALALGMEVECRLSVAITAPGGGASPGWYITGVTGGIGAAAAAGRLLGLDRQRMRWAIGMAAAEACGLRVTHGSMGCALVPGLAARNGLTAALMARAGFTCGDRAIEGPNGLLHVLAPSADPRIAIDGLGDRFEMLENAYKPYPCGIVIHPAVDACLQAVREHRISPEAIERVDLAVHPMTIYLCGRREPAHAADAQVSLYHWVAASLVHGRAGLAQAAEDCVHDARVTGLRARIFAEADERLGPDQARASFGLRDGRRIDIAVEHATGSLARPMSDAALAGKFLGMAEPVLGERRAAELLELCWRVASLGDVGAVARAACPEGADALLGPH